jgi:hypothetical protein
LWKPIWLNHRPHPHLNVGVLEVEEEEAGAVDLQVEGVAALQEEEEEVVAVKEILVGDSIPTGLVADSGAAQIMSKSVEDPPETVGWEAAEVPWEETTTTMVGEEEEVLGKEGDMAVEIIKEAMIAEEMINAEVMIAVEMINAEVMIAEEMINAEVLIAEQMINAEVMVGVVPDINPIKNIVFIFFGWLHPRSKRAGR